MKEVMLVARLQAKPNCHVALEKELKALATATYSEPGCLLYAFHRDAKDPSLFFSIERFASKEAFDSHIASSHLKKHGPVMASLMTGEAELHFLEPFGEGNKGRLR